MTDTDTANENTDTSRPVRVPNVSPNARSGLSGEVIGSNAVAAYDENEALAADGEPITGTEVKDDGVLVPAGTLEERIAWAREADEQEERAARADAIWQHEKATEGEGWTGNAQAALSADLRAAVYLDEPGPGDLPEVPADLTTVDDLVAWVKDEEDEIARRLRASAVLAAEEAADHEPRTTLVTPLQAILDAPTPTD